MGVLVGAVWGVQAAVAYAGLAALLAVLVYGLAVGGSFIESISRSRFDDDRRRR